MAYNGRHPNLYDNMTEEERREMRILDNIIHRHGPVPTAATTSVEPNDGGGGGGGGVSSPTHVVLADDSSSSDDDDDDDENAAMLEDAGLVFKRPVILQAGLRDEFQGRQVRAVRCGAVVVCVPGDCVARCVAFHFQRCAVQATADALGAAAADDVRRGLGVAVVVVGWLGATSPGGQPILRFDGGEQ